MLRVRENECVIHVVKEEGFVRAKLSLTETTADITGYESCIFNAWYSACNHTNTFIVSDLSRDEVREFLHEQASGLHDGFDLPMLTVETYNALRS